MAYFSDVGMLLAAFSGRMKPINTNHSLRMSLKGLLLVYVSAVFGLSPASGVLLVDSGTPEESGGLVVANPFEADGRTVGQFLAQAFSLLIPHSLVLLRPISAAMRAMQSRCSLPQLSALRQRLLT
jgi:hypothetical protein